MAAFGSPSVGQRVGERAGETFVRYGRGDSFACAVEYREEGSHDVEVVTASHRDAGQAGVQHGLEQVTVSSAREPLREDCERLTIVRQRAVEITRRLEHQPVVAQNGDAEEVVRAERPRHGVRERGEDGSGLLQFPAGRQDFSP